MEEVAVVHYKAVQSFSPVITNILTLGLNTGWVPFL